MNICFVIPNMAGGGAERVIANLSNYLSLNGHRNIILMTTNGEVAYELNKSIELVQLGNATGGKLRERVRRICDMRSFMKKHMDYSFVGMETSTNIYTLIAGIGLKTSIVVSERNDPQKYEARRLRDIIYTLLGKGFIFQTTDAKHYFSRKIQKNAVVIPNPVNPNLPIVHCDIDSKVVVAVGRLDVQKNYPLLIRSFAKIIKEGIDAELHIYGKGPLLEELSEIASVEGLEDKVVFKGFRSNVWHDIEKASVYVLSSDYEGMPNALIEAMALGLPVISTNCPIGGPSELITSGENGILVPIGDEDLLAKAMVSILTNKDFAYRLGDSAVKVYEELSISSIAEKWTDFLRDKHE